MKKGITFSPTTHAMGVALFMVAVSWGLGIPLKPIEAAQIYFLAGIAGRLDLFAVGGKE